MNYSNRFINAIFAPILSDNERALICDHVDYLLNSLDYTTVEIFQPEIAMLKCDITRIKQNVTLNTSGDTCSLTDIYTRLKKERTLLKQQSLAFICAELQVKKHNQQIFNIYKSFVLICAIRLAETEEYKKIISNVLNEIRQFSNGKRDYLLPYLPKNFQTSLSTLVNELDTARNIKEYRSSVKENLSKYFIFFQYALTSKTPRTRKSTNIGPRKGQIIILEPSHRIDSDDEGSKLAELKSFNNTKSKRSKGWQAEEANTSLSDKQTISVIYDKNTSPVEKQQRAIKAQAITNRIKVRNQSLPCDFKILTVFEIQTLIYACWVEIKHKSAKMGDPLLLLLSLLCGRTPDEIIHRQRKKKSKFVYDKTNQCWNLRLVHKTDTFQQEYEVSHLLSKVSEKLEISLPSELSSALGKPFKFTHSTTIEEFLTKLNKKEKTRLSLSRIANYFVDHHRQQNTDPVLVEVMLGLEGRHKSGIPYSHITSAQISAVFYHYCCHLMKDLKQEKYKNEAPHKVFELSTVNVTSTNIGSPLFISDIEIRRVNQQHIKHLKELKSLPNNDIDFHNYFVFYLYRMLTIASGYRPVTGTGGKLSDISLASGRYFISDKENRHGISARCIVLPERVISQIEHYLTYLTHLSSHFLMNHTEIYDHIQRVLSGEDHLLFFIDKGSLSIVEVTPKSILPYMDKQFPIALNWHRHYMRSKLMYIKTDPTLIDAFMGHEEIGQEGLGRFSGLSYYDFKQLAYSVEKILQHLNFEVLAHD